MSLKKFLLVLLPVLVALAAHYHRQGSLVLPPQLVGPAEELWQQLRVHLPFQVPVRPQRDSSAQASSAAGTPTQVRLNVTHSTLHITPSTLPADCLAADLSSLRPDGSMPQAKSWSTIFAVASLHHEAEPAEPHDCQVPHLDTGSVSFLHSAWPAMTACRYRKYR